MQPVRISRIVPSRESLPGGLDSGGGTQSKKDFTDDTVMAVLNGFRTQHLDDSGSAGGVDWASAPASDKEENCIDIFVEGFSRGIIHANLPPLEIYCRALQIGSRAPQNPSSVSSAEETPHSLCAREGYRGLTILLTRTGEWFDAFTDGGDVQGPQKKHRIQPDTDNDAGQDSNILASKANATRMIFTREGGKPGPSRNAFRVQFEPGPLGIELEEHPGQWGIVQVRRVLQAGQAELDGRLSPECLVVAVGDWGEPDLSASSPTTRFDDSSTGAGADGSLEVSDLKSNAKSGGGSSVRGTHKPAMIRSLAELEKVVSTRQPDQLLTLWALDRRAPEAIAVLGSPGSVEGVGPSPGNDGHKTSDHLGTSILRTTLANCSKSAAPDGAPGWESASAFARSKDSLEYSLSTTHPEMITHDHSQAMARGSLRIGEQQSVAELSASAFGSPKGIARGRASSPSEENHSLGWTRRHDRGSIGHRPEKEGTGSTGGWEFETGGGVFDEGDQRLAARKQPASNTATAAAVAVSSVDDKDKEPPAFPLGLNASAVDEFAVFIWFCNNHESSVMNVRRTSEGQF